MKQNVMAFGLMALVAFSAINAGADSEVRCTRFISCELPT